MGCFQSVAHLNLRDGMPAKGGMMSVVVSFFSEKARERERYWEEGEVGAGGRVCV